MAACAAEGVGKDGAILERAPGQAQCWPAIPRLIPRGLTCLLSLTAVSGSRRYARRSAAVGLVVESSDHRRARPRPLGDIAVVGIRPEVEAKRNSRLAQALGV